MAETCRIAPHADIDFPVPRQPLLYRLTAPDRGIRDDTGVVFYIHGYGGAYDDAYAEKLRSHLADTYNCVAVTVNYFGSALYVNVPVRPAEGFFEALRRHHGVSVTEPEGGDKAAFIMALLRHLHGRGLRALHPACRMVKLSQEYHSFGVLPALDHLVALHDIRRRLSLDKRRSFVIGTSYGGYIALLLLKLAPHTFRLVVDNCGFSSAEDDLAGVYGESGSELAGVRLSAMTLLRWSDNPRAPTYFAPHHQALRDLRRGEHFLQGETMVRSWHGVDDTVAPTHRKRALEGSLGGRLDYRLRLVDSNEIDGRLFKTPAHGLGTSMRGLFERAYEEWSDRALRPADADDFALGTALSLACEGHCYDVRYGPAGVRMSGAVLA